MRYCAALFGAALLAVAVAVWAQPTRGPAREGGGGGGGLPQTGGTMAGDIDMDGTYKIFNIGSAGSGFAASGALTVNQICLANAFGGANYGGVEIRFPAIGIIDFRTSNIPRMRIQNLNVNVKNSDFVVNDAASVGTGTTPISGTRMTYPIENDPISTTIAFAPGLGIYAIDSTTLAFATSFGQRITIDSAGVLNVFGIQPTIKAGGSVGLWLDGGITPIVAIDGGLAMLESATVPGGPGAAGVGRFWVRNDVPSTAVFTDDTNVDRELGDLFGPASSTDGAVCRYDLTTGKLVQNSIVTISDIGLTSGPIGEVFTEQASVPGGAPAAGTSTLWIRNDTPNVPIATDDTGIDVPLGNHVLQTQYTEATTDQTWSPLVAYTWTDLTPLTVNITASGSHDLLIYAHVSASNPNANRDYRIRILVDAVSSGGGSSELRTGGVASTVSLVKRKSVAAGARVVKVQWTTNGTINCRPVTAVDVESASLMVQEVR